MTTNHVQIVSLTLNPAIDKSCSIDNVVPEHKLRCHDVQFHPGGGGINVARAIKTFGGEAMAYWTRGGALGELLQSCLDDEGVNHHPVPIADMTRENVIVFEESSGQQYRFGMPGARLTKQEENKCLDLLVEWAQSKSSNSDSATSVSAQTKYVVLSGSLPPGCDDSLYAKFAEALKPHSRVVLDASGESLRLGLQQGVFLIKPNKRELDQLFGRTITNDSQIRDAAKQIIDAGKAEVVVTSLGSGGATLTTSDTHEHFRTPTVEIRSKVGAGDSMVAGMVYALSKQMSIRDAIRFGVAAGAAAVMTEGTELCRREDTERLYKEIP